jgi:hypothetical protein
LPKLLYAALSRWLGDDRPAAGMLATAAAPTDREGT